MRDTLQQPVHLRSLPRWMAALALVLAACLNPRPEELPSAQNLDGPGSPGAGDGNENVAIEPPSPTPAPVDPDLSIDEESPSSPDPNGAPPAVDADAGPDTRTDAGAPDAGD